MTVISVPFFLFFGLSLLIYYLIPRRFQWVCLLVFSLSFFLLASGSAWTILYFLLCALCTWLCARQIERALSANNTRSARRALIIGIVFNVGILAVLKYCDFIINNVNALFGTSLLLPPLAAPIGISFYTFSALGYLLSLYWGAVEHPVGLAKTVLFVGYYPVLTSGPIVRYQESAPQLFAEHRFNYRSFTFGLQRMLWGFFLKLVISARLANVVNTVYGNLDAYPGLFIWMAAALFMLQLYTDFSGYMEIILGASECYGIVLPENFRAPFFSRSVQEFWQRWHITLGGWMRDYILFPILRTSAWRRMTSWIKAHFGKKAAKQIPAYLGMLCVWLLIGLWHGGAWKYILGQGLWFWSCIVLAQVLEPLFKKITSALHINTGRVFWHVFQSIRVFVLVCIGNMFFRLNSISEVFHALKLGLSIQPAAFVAGIFSLLPKEDFLFVCFGLAVLFLVSALQTKRSVRERLAELKLPIRWTILILLLFSVLFFGVYGPNHAVQDFIYAQF